MFAHALVHRATPLRCIAPYLPRAVHDESARPPGCSTLAMARSCARVAASAFPFGGTHCVATYSDERHGADGAVARVGSRMLVHGTGPYFRGSKGGRFSDGGNRHLKNRKATAIARDVLLVNSLIMTSQEDGVHRFASCGRRCFLGSCFALVRRLIRRPVRRKYSLRPCSSARQPSSLLPARCSLPWRIRYTGHGARRAASATLRSIAFESRKARVERTSVPQRSGLVFFSPKFRKSYWI